MQQLLPRLTPATAVPAGVDAVMTMLQSVAGRAAELTVHGVEVAAVEEVVAAARQQVDGVVAERQQQAAAELALPADATIAAGGWRLPEGVLPPELAATAEQQGLAAAKAREAANLASVEFVSQGQSLPALLQELLPQLSKHSGGPDCAVQAALRATEQALFRRAAAGFVQPPLSPDDAAQLAKVVDSYRVALTAFRDSLPANSLAMLRTELRSREVLVCWVAYCLTHQAACAAHLRVQQYGVALDWQDLQHLTLTDIFQTKAAVAGAASYLRRHSKPGQELFHLSKQRPTLRFAEAFAAADDSMCSMLAAHRRADQQRMAAHWKQVQKQQREAEQLAADITDLESRRSSLSRRWSDCSYHSETYNDLTTQISKLDRQLGSKKDALKQAETPPPAVIQPLPRDESWAGHWLFFLTCLACCGTWHAAAAWRSSCCCLALCLTASCSR